MRIRALLAAGLLAAALPASAFCASDDIATRLERLDAELRRQSDIIREQQKTIEELRQQMQSKESRREQPQVAQVEPPQEKQSSPGSIFGSIMSNPYLSVVLDAKGYISNLKNQQRATRGVPGYTTEGQELKNGFNVDAAELFIFAPVDPYFNLYANIPITDSGATLEEAYVVTTALPAGFQIKGGRFKSDTSRLNAQHPHAWDFADLPLPYRAFLGAEGAGGDNGLQLTYQPPTPFYTLLGFEAQQGSNPLLFGEDDNLGPHAFSLFAKASFDTSENSSLLFGPWAMFGSSRTDRLMESDPVSGNTYRLRGDSALYGMEALWKWKEGKQAVTLQGEYLFLAQQGDLHELDSTGSVVGSSRLLRRQDGVYLQALYQYDRWRIGARYDRMDLFSSTFKRDDVQENFSGKPWRATASLEFNPTEFTRIRTQFSHDRSARDGRVNNEGILQFIFSIGAHAAHKF